MKRTDEQLRFIIEGCREIKRGICVKTRTEHRLLPIECEQLRDIERAKRNAYVNLNQAKMRKWGK